MQHFTNFLAFLVVAVCLCNGVVGRHGKRDVSNEQLSCFSLLLNHLTNDDETCLNVGNAITGILDTNLAESIRSVNAERFGVFCRPTCGRNIITAWKTCNITTSETIDTLIEVCGRENGFNCYENLDKIFDFIEDVEDCALQNTENDNQCSQECRNTIDNGEDMYGCCVNVPVEFRNANGESDLSELVTNTFSNCFDERPDRCKEVLINQTITLSRFEDMSPSLSPEQILCIADTISENSNLVDECKMASNNLLVQLNSKSLLRSIFEDRSAITTFCNPSCGPIVMESWMSCNAYEDIKGRADFLVGLCGIHQGSTCYSKYDEVVDFIDDSFHCGQTADSEDDVVCSPGCERVYTTANGEFGCCGEVIIDYAVTLVGSVAEEVTGSLFTACGAERPGDCSSSALTAMMEQPMTEQPSQCPNAALINNMPTAGLILAVMGAAILHALMTA